VHAIKPKFHYADFHRNFPAGKVVYIYRESRGQKSPRHVEMFATKSVRSPRQTRLCRSNGIWSFRFTMHGESWRQSRRQSPGQVPDKVADLSRTQIMKVGDVIRVADFHDLCPRQVRDSVVNLSQTLSHSRRNGIWASASFDHQPVVGTPVSPCRTCLPVTWCKRHADVPRHGLSVPRTPWHVSSSPAHDSTAPAAGATLHRRQR